MLILAACGPDGHHARVEGRFEGINEAQVLAYVEETVDDVHGGIDTIAIRRGKFSYERELEQPVVLTLLYPNFSATNLVVEPGKKVRLKGDANRLSEIEIDGNDDNLLLTEFRKHTAGKSTNEVQREAATFIRAHAQTLAAAILFREHFANTEVITSNPTASLLAELERAQAANPLVASMAQRIKPLLKTAPGCSLPQFSTTALEGGTISSQNFSGKNLLIVFCAHSDGSFYVMKRCATELRKHLAEDELTMLFIDLDARPEGLINANKYDPLPGKIAYDGKAFDSPLITTLGMRYIAGSLLVGRNGKILARDIPYEHWVKEIPTLL